MTDEPMSDLERAALEEQTSSVWAELGMLLWENKSWWLMPVVIALGLLGVVIVLGGSAAAPFIYTLF
jgi:hypothetical protein